MRAYELFTNADSNAIEKDKYFELAKNALLSDETSNEELVSILSRYDIQYYYGLSIIPSITESFIKQNRLLKLQDYIYQYISNVASHTKIRPIELILELTISNNGVARIIGRKLIDYFKITPLELDTTSFSEEQQIKYLISLTQDWVSGEIRIPLILQLLNADSVKVRSWFLIVMQNYSLNYYGLIVEHLKKGHFRKTKEFQMYKKYLKSLEQRFEIYHNCPELYSEYQFPDIFDEAKRSEKGYMQEMMDIYDKQHKSAFIEMFPLIALGRGGGWRQPDGTVQPLAKIAFSTTPPMLLSAQTPLEERIQAINIYKDWNPTNEI